MESPKTHTVIAFGKDPAYAVPFSVAFLIMQKILVDNETA